MNLTADHSESKRAASLLASVAQQVTVSAPETPPLATFALKLTTLFATDPQLVMVSVGAREQQLFADEELEKVLLNAQSLREIIAALAQREGEVIDYQAPSWTLAGKLTNELRFVACHTNDPGQPVWLMVGRSGT